MYLIELQRHDCSRSTETIGSFSRGSDFLLRRQRVFKGGVFKPPLLFLD
ncbi:hypothetical protein SY94_2569 [Agrobacterium tumefaciens]|nr:hypothetical protein SY94_2569 [Agrobacterium tumefaciens]